VGVSSSPAHLWISTSHIVNKVPSGSLVTVDTIVSISHVNGKQNNMLSFLAPLLTVTTMSNSPTSGSVHFRVFGAQLGAAGYSPKLFSQHTQSERTSWLSDSIISSKMNSGSFQAIGYVMSVTRAVGSLTKTLSYDQPSITSVAFFLRQLTFSGASAHFVCVWPKLSCIW